MAHRHSPVPIPAFAPERRASLIRTIRGMLWLILLLPAGLSAQEDTIRLRLLDYAGDTLWFGPTHGRNVHALMAAVRDTDSTFAFQTGRPLPPGMYGFITRTPGKARPGLFHFWKINGEHHLHIETTFHQFYQKAKVSGSAENSAYYRYMSQYELLGVNLANTADNWKMRPDAQTYDFWQKAEQAMERFQENFIREHPGTLTAQLAAQTLYRSAPAHLTEPADRLAWQQEHFFEGWDWASTALLRQPQWIDRLDYYLLMLPPPDPGVLLPMADALLERLARDNPEALAFYGPYLMQLIEPLNRNGLDELYVHLVRAWLETGRLGDIPEDRLEFHRLNAGRMARLFIGQAAPELRLQDPLGQPLVLSQLPRQWTLMLFWQPDCQICHREIPRIRKAWDRYKEDGLQVLAICGRSGSRYGDCWTKASELKLPGEWMLAGDPDRQSRFPSLYNVRAFPHLVLLDPEGRIAFKQAGAAPAGTLEAALTRLMGTPPSPDTGK